MNTDNKSAHTVEEYLQSVPADKRRELSRVRRVILEHLPEGYEEVFAWGMITYQVPLERYPATYNGKPLMYAALATQKNHISLYLTGIYLSSSAREEFENAYRASGKRLDAAKSCVRFVSVDDLPLDVIGDEIASLDIDTFIEKYEQVRRKPLKMTG
ncbi:MAG: DUF1801 domain-containing protein [Chitinivibrionales bacterium]|nr:DUF1801 domain-containing protein [Chitinivibrionales bacterium]MBD3356705.1 DUF1801 domain-containing protein [Chitinivibrionales bacterium]